MSEEAEFAEGDAGIAFDDPESGMAGNTRDGSERGNFCFCIRRICFFFFFLLRGVNQRGLEGKKKF